MEKIILASAPLEGRNGHEAGRQLLAALYREHVGEELPEIRTADRGKPFFADSPWHFSISHTPRRVFCALSRQEVGIDADSPADLLGAEGRSGEAVRGRPPGLPEPHRTPSG